MIFVLLFSVSQSIKKICICNNDCSSFCASYKHVSNSSISQINDYIKSNLKKENEIEIDFYSKDDGFYFDIDFTLFESTNINLKTLSNSKSIKINIKEGFQYIKTIDINPNNQIKLPDLLHFNKHPIYSHKKSTILEEPEETPIPVSITVLVIKKEGKITCQNNHCKDEIDPKAQCGEVCLTNSENESSFEYTFKGERFSIYGNLDPNYGSFDVILDKKKNNYY